MAKARPNAELGRAVAGQPDVAGLEVAMDRPGGVRVLERARHLERDRAHFVGSAVGDPAAMPELVEIAAGMYWLTMYSVRLHRGRRAR